MTELESWCCKECGEVLGWQDGHGLSVDTEAVARYTLPAAAEEIWVTCGRCGTVQIWRAKVELSEQDRQPRIAEQGDD